MMYINTNTNIIYKSVYDIQKRCNLQKYEVMDKIANGLYKPINKRQYNNMIDKHIINYPNIEKRYLEYYESLDIIEIG